MKRVVVGLSIALLAFIAYQSFVAPDLRMVEELSGSFMGRLSLSTPEVKETIEGKRLLGAFLRIVGTAGLGLAVWGGIVLRRPSSRD